MFFDPMYFVFMIPALLLSLWAQSKVKGTFKKYSQVMNSAGLTGQQTSREVLNSKQLFDVPIEPTKGVLSDQYDPRSRVLKLSESVYGVQSISAMAVAAHEAGHAIQHAEGYRALRLRSVMVPAVSIGTNLGMILIFAGIFMSFTGLAWVGVALFSLATIFTLVTLPVEFDASKRAKERLNSLGLVNQTEAAAVDQVLDAAAWTYVAAVFASVTSLLYYISLISGRRD